MSLIVEDGTGLATAESYISVADAGTYHSNRGNTAWAALTSDTVREQYLRKGTDYIEQVYGLRWQGYQVYPTVQALSWPRYDVWTGERYIESDEIPTAIKNACAELALKAATETLNEDLEQGVIREKVGSIEVEYDKSSPQAKRYKAVDAMLAPFLKAGGGGASMSLVRC